MKSCSQTWMPCIFIAFGVMIGGCGYRWQVQDAETFHRPSIFVPYVSGDSDGALTAEIIRALSISGICTVHQHGAHYRLQAAIMHSSDQVIGYRRDRQQIHDQMKKNLTSSESRKTMVVEVSLFDETVGKIVWGPEQVEADIDYDYLDGDSLQDLVFVASNQGAQVVLPFSLGQLEPIESAQEAAVRPLYNRLAKKIVDAMAAGWY